MEKRIKTILTSDGLIAGVKLEKASSNSVIYSRLTSNKEILDSNRANYLKNYIFSFYCFESSIEKAVALGEKAQNLLEELYWESDIVELEFSGGNYSSENYNGLSVFQFEMNITVN